MKTESNYSTSDLAEASFLYASGRKLLTTERDSGRIWFAFADRVVCKKLTEKFWNKEAVVNAKEFYDAIRTLKDLIFRSERS